MESPGSNGSNSGWKHKRKQLVDYANATPSFNKYIPNEPNSPAGSPVAERLDASLIPPLDFNKFTPEYKDKLGKAVAAAREDKDVLAKSIAPPEDKAAPINNTVQSDVDEEAKAEVVASDLHKMILQQEEKVGMMPDGTQKSLKKTVLARMKGDYDKALLRVDELKEKIDAQHTDQESNEESAPNLDKTLKVSNAETLLPEFLDAPDEPGSPLFDDAELESLNEQDVELESLNEQDVELESLNEEPFEEDSMKDDMPGHAGPLNPWQFPPSDIRIDRLASTEPGMMMCSMKSISAASREEEQACQTLIEDDPAVASHLVLTYLDFLSDTERMNFCLWNGVTTQKNPRPLGVVPIMRSLLYGVEKMTAAPKGMVSSGETVIRALDFNCDFDELCIRVMYEYVCHDASKAYIILAIRNSQHPDPSCTHRWVKINGSIIRSLFRRCVAMQTVSTSWRNTCKKEEQRLLIAAVTKHPQLGTNYLFLATL